MKKHLYFFMVVAFAVIHATAGEVATNSWGAATNDVQMGIAFKSGLSRVEINHPVELVIRYRNISTNKYFSIYQAQSVEHDPSFLFKIISPTGKNLSPTSGIAMSGMSVNLKPNQNLDINFNLSAICKFDEAGTYKVIATKNVYWPKFDNGFEVVSNPLDITIMK